MHFAHVFLIATLGYCLATYVTENVVFQKTNEITTTHARWLITVVHDLQPYESFIRQISKDIDTVQDVLSAIVTSYNRSKEFGYSTTLTSLRKEIDLLREIHVGLLTGFNSYSSLSNSPVRSRTRRSLIPIIGDALSFLFGTVSSSDLDGIRKNIKDLAKNQKDIIHYLDESMSLINTSRTQIAENRRSIMELVTCVQKFDRKIEEIREEFNKRLYGIEQFLNTYQQFVLILDEVKQTTQRAAIYLENLRVEINMLSMNHLSPSTIAPNALQNLLSSIRSQLPNSLDLPADPAKDLWQFYKTLSCRAIAEEKKILIIINVPLLDHKGQYDVYIAYNLPFPYFDQDKMSTEMQDGFTKMVARYEIESKTFMVNADRTRFALLSETEYSQCNNKYLSYCRPRGALYPTNLSKMCIISLFLKRQDNINAYCKILVSPNIRLPVAHYMEYGRWAIASHTELKLTIVCEDKANNYGNILIVKPPLQVIQLNMSCHAANDYLMLPPYYEMNSEFSGQNPLQDIISPGGITKVTIWNEFKRQVPEHKALKLPDTLTSLKEIPMPLFIRRVHEFNTVQEPKQPVKFWVYLLIGGSLTLGIGVIALIIWQIILYVRKRPTPIVKCCGNKGENANSYSSQKSMSHRSDGAGVTMPGSVQSSTSTKPDEHNKLCKLYPELCSLTKVEVN